MQALEQDRYMSSAHAFGWVLCHILVRFHGSVALSVTALDLRLGVEADGSMTTSEGSDVNELHGSWVLEGDQRHFPSAPIFPSEALRSC